MKANKTLYVLLTMVLGLMLSFLAHAIIEIKFIISMVRSGLVPVNYSAFGHGNCFLPSALQVGLLALGLIGGFFLGQYWWKMVYVQKKHWWQKKKK